MRALKGRAVLAAILVFALALGTGGCPRRDPQADKLVIAVSAELDGMDIQQVYTANIVQEMISAAPVVFDLNNEQLVPNVAESISFSPDGKSIIMVFPDDLRFADGDPVTGADIKAAYERYIEISPYSGDWGELERIDVDGQQVTLVFKTPPAYFLAVLASMYSGIVDVELARSVGNEAFNRQAVGIGPYLLTEWVPGSHATFQRNPHWRSFKPFVRNRGPWKFETVTVRIIPDGLTRLSELEAGNVDLAAIAPEHRRRVAENEDLVLLEAPDAGQTYLRFNLHRAPFADRRFREALAYAVNRDELNLALDDAVGPIWGLLSPAQLAFSAETEAELKANRPHDPERARQLLAELGYADANGDGILDKDGVPLRITLLSTVGVHAQEMAAPVLQRQFQLVGVDVAIEEQGRPYVRERVRANDYDISLAAWAWIDPDIWYFSFHSSQPNPIWTSPEADRLLEQGRVLMNMAERTANYAELSRRVAEEVPIISLFYTYVYTAHRRNLRGLHVAVDGAIHYEDASK
ncbi:MAG TPA: ABC transporter substrate-binding protein [Bacillota bacterium]|nr:ABC transporter substrate-binding protein [Bacillota bacterium]